MSIPQGTDTVVALGGGHGLAASLSALVMTGVNPVGIVSVADDGGSSGRLRKGLGLEPPGDVRKCLVALAEYSSVWTSAFDYRFTEGELAGHSLGNLIIAGLTEVTGDFTDAIELAQELIGVKGSLYPSSAVPVTLGAIVSGEHVLGQVKVMHSTGIESVFTIPENPNVPEAVVDAISQAKTIVAGPGSLFTSVLAVLSIQKIRESIQESRAKKVYVVNLKPQIHETLGLDISDHIRVMVKHGFVPDVILADNAYMELGDSEELCEWLGCELILCPLADGTGDLHDRQLLAEAFAKYG